MEIKPSFYYFNYMETSKIPINITKEMSIFFQQFLSLKIIIPKTTEITVLNFARTDIIIIWLFGDL